MHVCMCPMWVYSPDSQSVKRGWDEAINSTTPTKTREPIHFRELAEAKALIRV